MTVECLQTVVVAQYDKVAVTVSNVSTDTHATVECSIYGIACLKVDICTLMYAATARTILRCNTSLVWIVVALERVHQVNNHRHRKILQLNLEGLNLCCVPLLGEYRFVQYVDVAVTHEAPSVVVVKNDVQTLA